MRGPLESDERRGDILELVDEFKDLVLLELWVFFAQFDSLHVDCTWECSNGGGRY
jgi:hypothetical protein